MSDKRTSPTRRAWLLAQAGAILAVAATASAQPAFVNGLVVAGSTLDATGGSAAGAGRFGQFSDLSYDPIREEWWALSDRGPGGGLLDYHVRLHRISLRVQPVSGHISDFRIEETVLLDEPSRRFVAGSMRCRSPSSSPRRGSKCCPRKRCCIGWSTPSCSRPPPRATFPNDSRR